ncbi:aldo/keto reductase [Saezia sanguinis]|uniref:aldo/keto reductase n=1 Tax=Saezia sanguinis TaxID=1965230 RepID=UPI00304DDBCB
MQLRALGRSGLKTAPLVFGGNVFGWTADEATSFSLLDAWLDAGFNMVDTADVYSSWVSGHAGGESETVIGKWLKATGKRDRVILATKLGKPMGARLKGLSRAYMKQAVEASLRRLQTDYIDLYQAHEDDASTPLEETLGAFADLIKEGKVRAIGASNYTAERFEAALNVSEKLGLPRYESMQPEYNLYDRQGFEARMQTLCVQKQVGVINYYGLAAGFLSGKYRSEKDLQGRARGVRIIEKGYMGPRGMRILAALDSVAQKLNTTPAAVTLAWELAQPGITAPIVSATSLTQLHELAQAAALKLGQDDMDLLTRASHLP